MNAVTEHLSHIEKEDALFLLRDLPQHLKSAGRKEQLERILTDLDFIQARFERGLASYVAADYFEPPPFEANRATLNYSNQELHDDVLAVLNGVGEDPHPEHGSGPALKCLREHSETQLRAPAPLVAISRHLSVHHFEDDRGASNSLRSMRNLNANLSLEAGRTVNDDHDKIRQFAGFVLSHHHVLSSHPEEVIPSAWNYGSGSAVSTRAEDLINAIEKPWIASTVRSPQVQPVCRRTLLGHSMRANSLALRADGRLLISAASDETMRIWDIASGSTQGIIPHPGMYPVIAATPDLSRLIAASKPMFGTEDAELSQSAGIFDIDKGSICQRLSGHSGQVNSVGITDDGSLAITASDDGTIRVWDINTKECRRTLSISDNTSVDKALLSQDGKIAVALRRKRTIDVWDVALGKLMLRITDTCAADIAMTPDARFLLSSETNDQGSYSLRLWDLASGECLQDIDLHGQLAYHLAISTDGRLAVTLGAFNEPYLRIWDLATGECVRDFIAHEADQVIITSDCESVISAGSDGSIKVWDITRGIPKTLDFWEALPGYMEVGDGFTLHGKKEITNRHVDFRHTFFLPNGSLSMCKNDDNILSLFIPLNNTRIRDIIMDSNRLDADLLEGINPEFLPNLSNKVPGVVITEDGTFAAWISSNGTPMIWNLLDGTCRRVKQTTTEQDGVLNCLAFTPDGQFLVSLLIGRAIHVWHVRNRSLAFTIGDRIHCFAVSPRQSVLVAAKLNILELWDLTSKARVAELFGHDAPIYALSLSPDGNYAVSASDDETIRLWDIRDPKCIAVYYAGEKIRSLSKITPGGCFACSSFEGKLLRLEVRNVEFEPPVVTQRYLWEVDIPAPFMGLLPPRDQKYRTDRQSFEPGELIPGHFDAAPTVRCPHCNAQTKLVDELAKKSDEFRDGSQVPRRSVVERALRYFFERTPGEPATDASAHSERIVLCQSCNKSLLISRWVIDNRSQATTPRVGTRQVIKDWVVGRILITTDQPSFQRSDLSGLDLGLGDFTKCDLRDADLSYARLICADFSGADLRHANLCGADLRFDQDVLQEIERIRGATNDQHIEVVAKLTGIKLLASLASAKLKGAKYDSNTRWPEFMTPERHGAKLV